ncbi:MAG: hypothetical protein H7X79_11615 [Sporomusaceae bacterium]|nr:hypothetical protein [Sporomusaceae bacterium]
MFNLIKYELRGKLLTIVGICLQVIIGNLFLTSIGPGGIGVTILSAFLGLFSIMLIFLSSLTLMSDYLYDEQGYLLFTLPQSGVSITASRLIAAVIQISIVTIVSLIMFFVIDQGRVLNNILQGAEVHEILTSILMYLWTIVSALTFIYFCMVIGKITFKGKKIGKIGSFIIFFLLSGVRNWLSAINSNFFPQIMHFDSLTAFNTAFTINVGNTVFDVVIFGLLFMTTSYLLEHKVDL